jgi:hypothetical protein
MPAKSRRNRRNIPQRKPLSSPEAVNTAPADMNSVAAAQAVQPEKVAPRYNPTTKSADTVESTYPYIGNELKWVGITTAIVAVIMVLLYIFLH